ncbi:MAG: NAD(P)H nitroreductase [Clostridiales bacterium]|jgi:nitroreductase|nr:NAD(P)H nitroreductase [Clostridiales bacterium]
MELYQAINTRESCRDYEDRPVEREKLNRLLEAARMAPSAGNGQPARYVVVTNKEMLARLVPLTQIVSGVNLWMEQAPCLIVVYEQLAERCLTRYGDAYLKYDWPGLDIGLATAQICLAATAEGLGTCIVGSFDVPAIQKLLDIPADSRLRLMIAVGYPKQKPLREKKRMALEELVRFEE